MKCEQQVVLIANFMSYRPPSTVIVVRTNSDKHKQNWTAGIGEHSKRARYAVEVGNETICQVTLISGHAKQEAYESSLSCLTHSQAAGRKSLVLVLHGGRE